MNILIPHQWLLEQLDTEATPEEIQKHLSLSGPSVERIYEKPAPVTSKTGTESVSDIEVTTNRVDSMSVRGVAREAAVILTQAGFPSKLRTVSAQTHQKLQELSLPIIKDNGELCKRVMCVVLKDVERTQTPDWMAERLQLVDQNIHDSVIDITNYITHELGHPVHAFDYDKIMEKGGVINVTLTSKGKQFTTLDNQTYTTVGGEVVFESDSGEIIDLPAIKGTANTSIDKSTKNVLLWIENLPAEKVRFASMTHAIRTVAAQLLEKKVDAHLAEDVLSRGIELYVELCNATVASDVYDHFPTKSEQRSITVPQTIFKRYLGINVAKETIEQILQSLECLVTYDNQNETYNVSVPSFRPDLEIAADIVEEIARIYGYHNLPSKIMDTEIPLKKQTSVNFDLENRIKHFLANVGLQEVYTYSMVSEQLALESGYTIEEHLKLQNPLSEDRTFMRRSLVPSLVEVLRNNSQKKNSSVFEIANVYTPVQSSTPEEKLKLSIVSSLDYRHLRGVVEALLSQLFITIAIQDDAPRQGIEAQSAHIYTESDGNKVELGNISLLTNDYTACTLDISSIVAVSQSHPTYKKPSSTAEIIEDLTFTVPQEVKVGSILSTVKGFSSYIKSVELSDIYNQNYTFTISYLDPSKNITTDDVEPIRAGIVKALQEKYHAELVGSI